MKTYTDETLMASSNAYAENLRTLNTRQHIIEILNDAPEGLTCSEIALAIRERYNEEDCTWQRVMTNLRWINGKKKWNRQIHDYEFVNPITAKKQVITDEYITYTTKEPKSVVIDGVEYYSKEQFVVTKTVPKKKKVYFLVG